MMRSTRHMKFILFLMLNLMFLFPGCSSKYEKDKAKSPDYADKIDIEVTLQPSSILEGLHKNDIIYVVTNNGDKTIIELFGEVAFYNRDGTEVGKMSWMFLFVDKEWEVKADESRKGAFRPLPAGKTMSASFSYLGFFVGREELRDKVKTDWENLTARPIIKKVIIE